MGLEHIHINKRVDMLHKKGWTHGDIHLGNLMCKNGEFAFLDFGEAVKFSGIRSMLYNPYRQHLDDLIEQDKRFNSYTNTTTLFR